MVVNVVGGGGVKVSKNTGVIVATIEVVIAGTRAMLTQLGTAVIGMMLVIMTEGFAIVEYELGAVTVTVFVGVMEAVMVASDARTKIEQASLITEQTNALIHRGALAIYHCLADIVVKVVADEIWELIGEGRAAFLIVAVLVLLSNKISAVIVQILVDCSNVRLTPLVDMQEVDVL